jgi:hypothetical protein
MAQAADDAASAGQGDCSVAHVIAATVIPSTGYDGKKAGAMLDVAASNSHLTAHI